MPKRIVDGEAIWTSARIREVQPPRFRAEYANLLPLALANGVFECDPVLVYHKVYSYNRPDVSYEDTRTILGEFERVGLVFRFGERTAKEWGYFVGIDKTGRLPPPTQRTRMACGPNPPSKELREFIARTSNPRAVLGQSYLGLVGVGFGRDGFKPTNEPEEPARPEQESIIKVPADRELTDQLKAAFEERFGQPDSWSASDYTQLNALRRRRKDLTREEIFRRYENLLQSPVAFHQQKNGSLRFFCTNFDEFINIPVNGNGAHHGKPDPSTRFERNSAIAGVSSPKVDRRLG